MGDRRGVNPFAGSVTTDGLPHGASTERCPRPLCGAAGNERGSAVRCAHDADLSPTSLACGERSDVTQIFGAPPEGPPGFASAAPHAQTGVSFVSFSCPDCGANLKVTPDSPRVLRCSYCQADSFLPRRALARAPPGEKAHAVLRSVSLDSWTSCPRCSLRRLPRRQAGRGDGLAVALVLLARHAQIYGRRARESHAQGLPRRIEDRRPPRPGRHPAQDEHVAEVVDVRKLGERIPR